MTFGNYLKSKQQLLIVWFVIHGIALFVNYFGIKGQVNYHTYILTEHAVNQESKSYFWPFVKFVYEGHWTTGVTSNFVGIFYEYDFSEFLAYGILAFLIAYWRWHYKSRTTKLPTNPHN
jgi:hypothetical protein